MKKQNKKQKQKKCDKKMTKILAGTVAVTPILSPLSATAQPEENPTYEYEEWLQDEVWREEELYEINPERDLPSETDVDEEETDEGENLDFDPPPSVEKSEYEGANVDFEETIQEMSTTIVASGTVGPGGAPWTLDTDSVVRIGGGTISRNPIAWGGSGSPFQIHQNNIRQIIFTEPVIAASDVSSLFIGLENLTSIEGLTHIDTINVTNMNNMFSRTSSLTSLDLSSFDTRNVTNMAGMFRGASSLTSLDLSSFDTINVTNMNGMFSQTSSLTSLDLSSFDTRNVTDMTFMFAGASSLTNLVDVSNWKTSSVTSMLGMFQDASSLTSLTSLDVSRWDTSQVTLMNQMFMGANSLTSLDVSNWETSSVTNMHGMFQGASSLTSLDVSNWDTTNVSSMAWMFSGANSLQNLTLGANFNFRISHANAALPHIQSTHELTGYWQNVGTGTVANPNGIHIFTSAELMTNYDGSTMADIFVWQEWRDLTFDLHGGLGSFPSQSVANGDLATAPTGEPTRDGYEFIGWFTTATGNVEFDFTARILSNTTVHAQWQTITTPVETYTLSFDINGGNANSQPVDQLLEVGELATKPTNPTKDGYSFTGWNTSQDGAGTEWNFATSTMPSNHMTLYAQWQTITTPVETYTLSFDINGGNANSQPVDQFLEVGELATKPTNPTKDGYSFTGWNTSQDGAGTEWNFATSTMPSNNMILYAQWQKDTTTGEDNGSNNGNNDGGNSGNEHNNDNNSESNSENSRLPQTGAIVTGPMLLGGVSLASGLATAAKKKKKGQK